MAPKDRRKQKCSIAKEESAYVEPWRNLPEQLLNFLKKEHRHAYLLNLKYTIGSAGVSKSWRSCASKKCDPIARSPWLELSNEPQSYCKTQQYGFSTISFENVSDYWWRGRARPRYDPWKHFHTFNPWSIVHGEKIPVDYCFLNSSRGRDHRWRPFGFDCCCFPLFVVYGFGQNQKWMKQESCQNCLLDPNDPKGQPIQFSNAVVLEGKYYAISLQGTLAVIEEIESQFQVTRLSRKRAIPSGNSKHFIEYFLESDGEILLILLISEKSNKVVDKVEVFKLLTEDLTWLKLDNLGDRALFAGINCCMPVSASLIGCRNNCVYFTHHAIDGWRLYDMRSDRILPCYDDYGSEVQDPVWERPITGKLLRPR